MGSSLVNVVIKSQDRRRVLISELVISGFALCNGATCRIPRVEVPRKEALIVSSCNLSDEVIIASVGRAGERWRETQDALESLFSSSHFRIDLRLAQLREI